jgi:hypothetical protein
VIRRYPTLLTMMTAALAFGVGLQPAPSQADGIAGTANYTLTATDALPAPTGPPPGTPSVTLGSTITSGSAAVSVPSTIGVAVGYEVSGTGIPAGTTVTQIGSGGSQVTLSQSATVTGPESLVFTPNIAPQVVALIEPAGGVVTPASSSSVGPLTILAGSHGFNASGVFDYLATTKDTNGNPLQALGLSFYGQGLASGANGGILNFSLNVANQSTPPQLVSQTPGVTIALQPASDSSSNTKTGTGTSISVAETPEPLSVLVWSALAGAGLLRARGLRKPRLPS